MAQIKVVAVIFSFSSHEFSIHSLLSIFFPHLMGNFQSAISFIYISILHNGRFLQIMFYMCLFAYFHWVNTEHFYFVQKFFFVCLILLPLFKLITCYEFCCEVRNFTLSIQNEIYLHSVHSVQRQVISYLSLYSQCICSYRQQLMVMYTFVLMNQTCKWLFKVKWIQMKGFSEWN